MKGRNVRTMVFKLDEIFCNTWFNFTRPWDILLFFEIFGIFHFQIWDIQISQILEYSIFHGISQNIPKLIWDIHRLGKSGI